MKEQLYAHYSAKSDMMFGHVVYRAVNDTNIICTCVCDQENPTDCCRWDDLKNLGPVESFVRSNIRETFQLPPDSWGFFADARK